jgi:inositol transport system ATP-binding protein
MIFQELSSVLTMSVAENIYIGREPRIGKTHFVDDKKMQVETEELFKSLGIEGINPKAKMNSLSTAQMQLVEICKAISYNSKLLIMDEPTSSIAKNEIEILFRIVRELKKTGVSFIFISHKLDEIFALADEITILRDGSVITTDSTDNMTQKQVVELMVGREIAQVYPKADAKIGEEYFFVEDLCIPGKAENISFTVRRGEILGFSGLVGAGRTDVMEAIFGYKKKSSGKIRIGTREVSIRNPKDAIQNGIVFLTEDRKLNGLYLPLDVQNNMLMPGMKRYTSFGIINEKKAFPACNDQIQRFKIKTPSIRQIISNLSGGNQQKILVARWLMMEPEIIILDEPTRGIDVGAKAEIYNIIGNLAQAGKCIIEVSSELTEVMGISDRIAVMHEGRLTKIFDRSEFDQTKIMEYATGVKA